MPQVKHSPTQYNIQHVEAQGVVAFGDSATVTSTNTTMPDLTLCPQTLAAAIVPQLVPHLVSELVPAIRAEVSTDHPC